MKASIISLLTIFSLSTLIATPAKSEMIRVANSRNNELKYYVDTDSITFDRNFVEALVTSKSKTPSIYGLSSVIARWKVNCSYRSLMYIDSTYYDVDGNLISANRKPSGWGAITPGSLGGGVYNFMCNRPKR